MLEMLITAIYPISVSSASLIFSMTDYSVLLLQTAVKQKLNYLYLSCLTLYCCSYILSSYKKNSHHQYKKKFKISFYSSFLLQ
jgi:hypothetical protein